MKITKTRIDHLGQQWIRLQLYSFDQDRTLADFTIPESYLEGLKAHINENIDKYLGY